MTDVVKGFDSSALLKRISISQDVCHGKPCIRETRIMVTVILELLLAGYSWNRILKCYPQLSEDDIRAAIEYSIYRIDSEEVHFYSEETVGK